MGAGRPRSGGASAWAPSPRPPPQFVRRRGAKWFSQRAARSPAKAPGWGRPRHVQVNGRTLDVPSYRVGPGDEVKIADASRELVLVKHALEQFGRQQPVSWIQVDTDKALGRMTQRPTRDAIPIAAQEQLIVELYSK